MKLNIKNISSENEHVVLLFKVTDTGIGIRKKDMKKLFLPFSQVHEQNTGIPSTGLGLAICKKLVTLMGYKNFQIWNNSYSFRGKIWVESKFKKGSTFNFQCRFKKCKPIKVEPKIEKEKFANSYPMKILIAEDNRINQIVVKNMLHQLGYRDIDIAKNGKEAVEMVQKKTYDLLFMDIHMPILE